MGIKELEYLIIELNIQQKEERKELLTELIEYFGKNDTQIILNIALYFKYPNRYKYLKDQIIKALRES